MTMLLLWILASFGLAYVCGHAFITRSFREWAFQRSSLRWFIMLLECPACFGYWIGTLTGPWAFHRADIPMEWWEATLLGSFVLCATNYLLARWTQLVPAAEWMQPTDNGAEMSNAVSGFGYCANKESASHHGIHPRYPNCIEWTGVQQVATQEAPR